MKSPLPSSLRRKITGIILVTSSSVLLLASVALATYELVSSRRTIVRNLQTTAEITAANSTAALMYQDRQVAYENLAALRADPEIEAAVLYDSARHSFVSFAPDASAQQFPAPTESDGPRFDDGRAILQIPVVQNSSRVGTLIIVKSLTGIYQRMAVVGWVLAGVLIVGGAIAIVLSALLQRRISDPILELARLATRVSQEKDYSVRTTLTSDDEIGELTKAFNSMLDEIERSQTALLGREAQLALVTDHSSVGLAHLDRQQRFKFVNQGYAARFRRKPRELIGVHLSTLIGDDLYAQALPHIRDVLKGQQIEFELSAPFEGGEGWAHIVYVPEFGPNREVLGFLAIVADITSRKRIEQDAERARDEALAASRAKDDFLAALSHELRTPLSPVLLLASEASNNPDLPENIRADFNLIRKSVELEARLIDDLLDLTRITRGKLTLERTELNAPAALVETLRILQGEIAHKGVLVETDFRTEASLVHADPVRLRQVFWNVISNAVKFTEPGGRIVVGTMHQAGPLGLLIRVTDEGIGMTADEIALVFEAFAQGEHAQSGSHRFGGLGLGLAISRSLVQLHGGRISASSAGRGKGTTISIELPLLGSAALASMPAVTVIPGDSASPIESSVSDLGACRLLLVDDHGPTRATLDHLLSRRGYHVLSAASMTDALSLATRETFDLVISDIGLPDGDGCTLMAQIRTLQPTVRGIALSGYGMEDDLARSRLAGFAAHLTKPVNISALDRAIAEVRAADASTMPSGQEPT